MHGETITQTSSLSSETYTYDMAGRLTEAQEVTPGAKICKARLYAYDEEGNRLNETNRESSTETCPSEDGTVEKHIYDAANRLIDNEVSYDALGDEIKLPAADAGKYELKSIFYNDGQVATQIQHEQTIEYFYDPAGRTREIISKGPASYTNVTHYAGPGEAITWINEGSEKWSRNIPGIDGALDAIQSSTGTTTLQLHDLQGNIVGQAGTSETETKLSATFNNTEFGVPAGSKTPAKYAWLGANGVKAEFETGIVTEGGASYVPQIGRHIQTASVVPPGAFPNGSGPGTPEETVIPGWITAINERESAATLAGWAAIQEAERKAKEGEDPECKIKIAVGHFDEKKQEMVYARGWAECEGKLLPVNSELEVCLIDEFTPQEGAEVPPLAVCALAGSGFNPYTGKAASRQKQLYAHWHLKCEGEKAYWGWAWFWVPGMKKGVEKYTKEPWECGETTEGLQWEIAVTFYEIFPAVGAGG